MMRMAMTDAASSSTGAERARRYRQRRAAGQLVACFAHVLGELAARDLPKGHNVDGYLAPPQIAGGGEAALAGDQPAVRRDDDRVQ